MADGFRRLGAHVHLCELRDVPEGPFDLCVISSLGEVFHAVGADEGRRRVEDLRGSVGAMMNLFAECARTRWFQAIVEPGRALGINDLVDVGFLDQGTVVVEKGFRYFPIFDGLLEAQVQQGPPPSDPLARTIPWAHVGMQTPGRVALTDRLVNHVAPHGLIYLSEVSPIKEKGSPHLDPEHMRRILGRTKFYVWCSHHDHFFMESLRFKTAWETGCVPIKVVGDEEVLPADLPFADFVVRAGQITDHLNALDFAQARSALFREYLKRPRFEVGLARILDANDLPRSELPDERVSTTSPTARVQRVA